MAFAHIPFADTGVTVSNVCLGTMMFGGKTPEDQAAAIMMRALDAGLNFWDTAPMYHDTVTESILGRTIGARRDDIFLATKVHVGVTYAEIVDSCKQSLARLKTDRVDLLQIHWPKEGMILEEMIRALDDLVQSGLVMHIGCCNFPAWVLAKFAQLADTLGASPVVSFQPPYNLIERGIELELAPLCLHEKIAIVPYRPLVIGLLAGKYRKGAPMPDDARGQSDDRIAPLVEQYGDAIEKLIAFAEARNVTAAAVAVSWLQAQPAVTAPIVGVSRMSQMEELIQHSDFTLAADEAAEVAGFFNAELKEFGLGGFPAWRRNRSVLAKT